MEPAGHADGTIPEALKEKLHLCEAVCKELEALANRPGADLAAEQERLQQEFDSVSGLPPEFEELLKKRFAEARKALAFAAEENEKRNAAFQSLVKEIDALAAAGELVTLKEIEQLEKKCIRFSGENAAFAADLNNRFSQLSSVYEVLKAEAEQAKLAASQAEKLAAELAALTAAEDIVPLKDNKERIEQEYAALGKVPAASAAVYNEAHKQASVKLACHYETLDLARWESYTHKLDLCKKLEELSGLPEKEMVSVSKQLHEIREKWKALGSVPREKSEEINPRYLELTRALQRKVDEFYTNRRQEQKLAAAEKQKLCDRAAELADSTDWAAVANEFKEMQKQWKALPGAGSAEHDLFAKFRASADLFFNARSVVLTERDRKFKEAADAKEALITAAEQLVPGNVREAKRLREAYQNTPSAGRNEHDLRKRFDAVMNNFFAALKDEFAQKELRAKELIAELEALAADPLAGHARAREIREEFHKLSCRATMAAEKAALDKFGTAFEIAKRREKESLFEQLESLAMQVASAWKNNEIPLPEDSVLEKYPKLRNAAKLIKSLREGDSAAGEKLDKLAVSARSEHERIILALESLSAEKQLEPVSLAAELEAAILCNFAAAEAAERKKKNTATPKQLQSEYLNAGLLPEEELQASFKRFAAAFAAAGSK